MEFNDGTWFGEQRWRYLDCFYEDVNLGFLLVFGSFDGSWCFRWILIGWFNFYFLTAVSTKAAEFSMIWLQDTTHMVVDMNMIIFLRRGGFFRHRRSFIVWLLYLANFFACASRHVMAFQIRRVLFGFRRFPLGHWRAHRCLSNIPLIICWWGSGTIQSKLLVVGLS